MTNKPAMRVYKIESDFSTDADHDQATNGFGSKILKVFKLSGYLQ